MVDFFKKEKPFLGYSGFGGGAAGLAAGGGIAPAGPGPTNVSGGTAYSYNGKFVHIFTAPGTFSIGAPNNAMFEFVVIGGGGGGGVYRGGGGGSGYSSGAVTVISSTLGGGDGEARVILRLV